ncbi:hypothetical protein EYF80_000203 [Liparis tanakae]|uniref:Uncharacterized protein n=1 Tax=Liparis tanakae TaxID=230148 RepID=A0A4Z2JHE2_9TELE|nr:hypothetical protein EYF80_000203 [Liparis tanakae]
MRLKAEQHTGVLSSVSGQRSRLHNTRAWERTGARRNRANQSGNSPTRPFMCRCTAGEAREEPSLGNRKGIRYSERRSRQYLSDAPLLSAS